MNKIIAITLGPGGLALVGQFQNFTSIAFGITSGSVTNAVVGTVAAGRDAEQRARAVGTSIACTAGGAALAATIVIFAAQPLADVVLGSRSLAPVMFVFAAAMVPVILNVVLLAIMAGLGHSLPFTLINVVVAAVSVPACWWLAVQHGMSGALVSALVVNASAVLLTIAWIWRGRLFPLAWLARGIDRSTLKRLFRLAGMSLSTITIIPAAQLLLRERIIGAYGVEAAGLWQAALKMGEVLIMLASVMISLHFLPRLADAGGEASNSVRVASAIVGVSLTLVAAFAVLTSGWILPVLFSADFSRAAGLLPAQLLGDALRGAALVLQAGFLARVRGGAYVLVDVLYSAMLVAAGYVLVARFAAAGAALAALLAGVVALVSAMLLTRSSGPSQPSVGTAER